MLSDWTWLAELGGFGSLAAVLWLLLKRVMDKQDRQDEGHATERKEWGTRMDKHAEMHRDALDKFGDRLERSIKEMKK